MRKRRVRSGVRVRVYPVVAEAVETALVLGWRRAFKHMEPGKVPSEEQAVEKLHLAVMNALCEVFDFDDEGET